MRLSHLRSKGIWALDYTDTKGFCTEGSHCASLSRKEGRLPEAEPGTVAGPYEEGGAMLVEGGALVVLVPVPLMYVGGVRSVEGPGGIDVVGGAVVLAGGAGVDAGAGT